MSFLIHNKQAIINILQKHKSPKMGGVYAWVGEELDTAIEYLQLVDGKTNITTLLNILKSQFSKRGLENIDYGKEILESIKQDFFGLTGFLSYDEIVDEITTMTKEELEQSNNKTVVRNEITSSLLFEKETGEKIFHILSDGSQSWNTNYIKWLEKQFEELSTKCSRCSILEAEIIRYRG